MAFIPSLIILFSPLAQRAAQVMRAVANRRAVKSLAELDDRQLKDIGLTRGQVFGALETPMLHDPSTTLVDITGRSAVRPKVRVQSADMSEPRLALTPREA